MLDLLIGHWSGGGTARYPTYGSYDFTENLIFKTRPDDTRLHYEQQALKKLDTGIVPSHWETGFVYWTKSDPPQLEIANVQIGGRMELLRGDARQENGAWILSFHSVMLVNDARMIETTRTFTLEQNRLRYTMEMATTATNQLLAHIEAELTRNK